jgi:hypothetical protein
MRHNDRHQQDGVATVHVQDGSTQRGTTKEGYTYNAIGTLPHGCYSVVRGLGIGSLSVALTFILRHKPDGNGCNY